MRRSALHCYVLQVCGPACNGTFTTSFCFGAASSQQSDALRFLSNVTCAPYTATYLAKQLCDLAALPGGTACQCVGGSDNVPDAGCCVQSGYVNFTDPDGVLPPIQVAWRGCTALLCAVPFGSG